MIERRERKLADGLVALAGVLAASLFYVVAGLGIAASAFLAALLYWRWRIVPRQGLRGAGYFCLAIALGIAAGAAAGFGLAAFSEEFLHMRTHRGGVLFFATLLGMVFGAIAGIRKLWEPLSQPDQQEIRQGESPQFERDKAGEQ
ncbi:MAG: hypothetical protein PHU21_00925 [Elusimicrobia bacterium]|nr:hypothetical protein [Elusimicrobiota bacterium]